MKPWAWALAALVIAVLMLGPLLGMLSEILDLILLLFTGKGWQ